MRGAWRTFRRATDRFRLLTDVVGGLLIVAFVIGGIAAATGGVWPPVVVVESGSMMHAIQETPYGRMGTIDVGDMVFVRGVDGPDDITTWAEGGKDRYGHPGDVIAYQPNGERAGTNISVIHRAIAYVEVEYAPGIPAPGTAKKPVLYRLHWIDGEVREWDGRGIYFPPLGFDESWGFSPSNGYKPGYDGFLTKGDNAFSNPATDQAMGLSKLVEPTWIVGKVYGEVPWMGLAKLAMQSGQTNPAVPNWERIGNAYAPLELWTMFFLTIALVVLVPLTADTTRAYRRLKREQENARRMEEENARRTAARKAELSKAKRVTTFATIVNARPMRPVDADGRSPSTGPGQK